MSHLPDIALPIFKAGTGLRAADLNAGFTALLNAVEIAMHTALSPDPAGVANEAKLADHEQRVAILEDLVQMHARQRNEKEWAPLSHLGAVLVRVMDLQRSVEEAVARLDAMHAELKGSHEGLWRRLARIEQQPEAATKEEHDSLFNEHQRIAEKEHMLLSQVVALRHETMLLREMTMGHDRLANRMEYTPLSTAGHLLQRIMEIEQRLGPAP